MEVNFKIDYTKCRIGGVQLLLEFDLLAATLPFPDFTIASRAVATALIQDPVCVNFVPPPTQAPQPPIATGTDNTLTFLLILLVFVLLLMCCVCFFIY
jgi:hypothetical protein